MGLGDFVIYVKLICLDGWAFVLYVKLMDWVDGWVWAFVLYVKIDGLGRGGFCPICKN